MSYTMTPTPTLLMNRALHDTRSRTDRLPGALLAAQWIAGIGLAWRVAPDAWLGTVTPLPPVWTAVLFGAVCALPAALAALRPGRPSTRSAIAVGQMLMGALLIHLWSQSLYGIGGGAAAWRWVEHAGWTVFVGVTLAASIRRNLRHMTQAADLTAALDEAARQREEMEQALARAVDELRATERRAEAAARAKSEFLAQMSREVRTPLNNVILHCELLQQDAAGRLHRAFGEDLDRIRASGNDLLTLLNGIVDLSRIDAGKMTMSLERFDLRTLMQSVAQTVDPLMQRHGNRLAVYYADELRPMCADLMKTRQILLNILTNAAKYTHAGTVTVDVGLDHTAARPTIFVAVADTGAGMTPQQMVRIFDPFARPDAAGRKPGVSGLGLAIVSRFCRLMGGTVSVDSCPGRGSRFIVRLPLEVAESSDAADAA
jgi:signal transduction histidine kinase